MGVDEREPGRRTTTAVLEDHYAAPVGLNKRVRKRFESRISGGEEIDAVVALQRDLEGVRPGGFGGGGVHGAYMTATGITDSLASEAPMDQQWCVLTKSRLLLFRKKASALSLLATKGPLEHELDRAGLHLRWGDYRGGSAKLRIRMMHFALADGRSTVQNTVLGSALRKSNYFDEADALVAALGDHAEEIDVAPYGHAPL